MNKLKYSSCPITAFAILAHDYPINIDAHPLPKLIDFLFKAGNIELKDILVPNKYEESKIHIEYDQEFYSKFFDFKECINSKITNLDEFIQYCTAHYGLDGISEKSADYELKE